ncbi:hypothetical protein FOZ76_16665 [Verticiella sediminum]|uniref:Asp/Glu racemase n=2 Tax=Verticiella sediminum TaxID=1247510 RepID=A0A556AJF5_9BURK|nr:hypothetical protein FOZ76_16665 [Verticiella sediminum]
MPVRVVRTCAHRPRDDQPAAIRDRRHRARRHPARHERRTGRGAPVLQRSPAQRGGRRRQLRGGARALRPAGRPGPDRALRLLQPARHGPEHGAGPAAGGRVAATPAPAGQNRRRLNMATPLNVGLMVPANNTTMEGEMLGWLPPGSTCRTLRVPRGNGLLTAETLPAYKAAAVELAARFDRDTLDVIAYGCTAAGFILGPEGDAGIAADLARVTGKPVVTTASAMVHALQQAGARRINVLTPYLDDVNERIRRFLAAGGIDVERLDSFLAPDVQALGRITAEQVRARAEPLLEPDVDALFIACSQLPTLSVIAPLAERFGKPVLSSIQVTAQRAMQYVP